MMHLPGFDKKLYDAHQECRNSEISGTAPSDHAVFLRPKFGPHSPVLPVFQRREGAEITLFWGILPAVLFRFSTLPAPLFFEGTLQFEK